MRPSINKGLLPIKAHFFLYVAGQACVLNYLSVAGKQAGISASQTAIIFGVSPLAAVLLKPFVGFIADRTRNITAVLVVLQVALLISTLGVFSSPNLLSSAEPLRLTYSSCPPLILETSFLLNKEYKTHCSLKCGNETKHWPSSESTANQSTGLYSTDCFQSCDLECVDSNAKGVLSISGFILYIASVVVAFSVGATIFSVTDAACYETLGNAKSLDFGKQRLWGTVSWGFASPLIGLLIDSQSTASWTNFTPAVGAFCIFMILDIILLLCSPRFETPATSENFFQDLREIYRDTRIIVFSFWLLMCGILIGVVWTYSVWFLEDLQATKTLTGLTFAMQSLVIEVPMFFISGYLIDYLGHFGCLTAAFTCFGIKLLGYSILVNPWYALIVDIAGGAIFPLFYAATTAFANIAATPGTAATMQCIFGAIFEGLGVAIGNLLCGYMFDTLGNRRTFRVMGTVAVACAIICALTTRITTRGRRKQYEVEVVYESNEKLASASVKNGNITSYSVACNGATA